MIAVPSPPLVRVIGDLITTDLHAAGSDPISKVAALWERNPGIDGMAVLEGERPRYLSRARFFVKLGKRFGYSLFENRPVALLAEEGSTVEADMDPVEVISIATQREADRVYDDIMVLENRRFRGLVSMRSLLVHHKTLLANGIAERSLLEERNRHLEELNRQQSQFVGALARELRGPTGTMLGLARSLLAEGVPEASRQRTVRGLVRSAHDALATVDDLQDLLRIELGTLAPVAETVALSSFVESFAIQAEPWLAEKGLRLLAEVPRPEEVSIDPVIARRILTNVLMASLDRADGPLVLTAVREDSALVFTLRGTHEALTTDELRELRSRSVPLAANMLGKNALRLAALGGLLRTMGGSLDLEAAPGSESTIRLSLPLR